MLRATRLGTSSSTRPAAKTRVPVAAAVRNVGDASDIGVLYRTMRSVGLMHHSTLYMDRACPRLVCDH